MSREKCVKFIPTQKAKKLGEDIFLRTKFITGIQEALG